MKQNTHKKRITKRTERNGNRRNTTSTAKKNNMRSEQQWMRMNEERKNKKKRKKKEKNEKLNQENRKTATHHQRFCNRILTSNNHLIKLKWPLEHVHINIYNLCLPTSSIMEL